MTIISSEITGHINKPNGGRKLLLRGEDQLGRIWEARRNVPSSNDDKATLALWVLQTNSDIPDTESSEEVARARKGDQQLARYQPQDDLDRKVITKLMQIDDSLEFSLTLPWFRAFEKRAGRSMGARATYLGISRSLYGEIAGRYNLISGLVTGLDRDHAAVWELGRTL